MSSMQKRIYFLTAFLALGFSFIWILPKSGERKLSRLERHLPESFSIYKGKRGVISQEELRVLAKDTEFERYDYINKFNPMRPAVQASIVFSGKDINNSIHRPERCLRSQGWNFTQQRSIILKNAIPGGVDVPFRELVFVKPQKLPNGKVIEHKRMQYYTFIGYKKITEGHYSRTFIDMKSRLFGGYDQQWAYVTFSMPITKAYINQGILHWPISLNLEETEKILEKFIRDLLPLVINPHPKGKEPKEPI